MSDDLPEDILRNRDTRTAVIPPFAWCFTKMSKTAILFGRFGVYESSWLIAYRQ